MMDFELKLEKPALNRAWISALVMGLSYFLGKSIYFVNLKQEVFPTRPDCSPTRSTLTLSLGGLVPMLPYFFINDIHHALFTSIGITVVVLLIFGYVKASATSCPRKSCVYSAFQTLLVGALAAATSYAIVRGVDSFKAGKD